MPRGLEREKYDIKKLLLAISQRQSARVKQLILAGTPTFIDGKALLPHLDVMDEQFLMHTIENIPSASALIKTPKKPGNNRVRLSEFLSQLQHFSALQHLNARHQAAKPASNTSASPSQISLTMQHPTIERMSRQEGVNIGT